jgi:hypothetical protein
VQISCGVCVCHDWGFMVTEPHWLYCAKAVTLLQGSARFVSGDDIVSFVTASITVKISFDVKAS